MSKLQRLGLLALVVIPLMEACYVPVRVREERRPPPPACRAFWVRGFTDRWGNWHPGHWQCERY